MPGLLLQTTSGGSLYTFPSQFDWHTLDDHGFDMRTKASDRFGAHGANQTGDLGIEPRIVRVSGSYYDTRGYNYFESLMFDLKKALYNEGQAYRLIWEETLGYINVAACKSLKHTRKKKGLAFIGADVEMEFLCVDPFWYGAAASVTTAITSSPQDIVFTAAAYINADSPLTIQADPTAPWQDFTVEKMDDGAWCRYADPGLDAGGQAIIDGSGGMVTQGGMNTIRYFSGAFLRVSPGVNNTFRYTGATGGSLTLSCPIRWL